MKKKYSILAAFVFFCLGISLHAQEVESSSDESNQEARISKNEPGTRIDYSDPTGINVYDDRGRFIGYKEGHQ